MGIPRIGGLIALMLVLRGCAGKQAVDQRVGGNFRFVSATHQGNLIAPADRRKAADFSGTLLSGADFLLSQDAGKVTVINFWATWCGPCISETPQFDLLYRANKRSGVAFVGVDTKDYSRDVSQAFVRENRISYPIIFDEQGETAIALGKVPVLGLPFTILVDRYRRVAAVYVGPLTPRDLQPVLGKLLGEQLRRRQ